MSVNELNMKLTQEIRELSSKKSKIQAEISSLTSDETKLRIAIKKATDTVTELEKNLASLRADESSSKVLMKELESQIQQLNETLAEKTTELQNTIQHIAGKKEQAKLELKSFIDGSIEDTKRKCAEMLEEAQATKDKATAQSLSLVEQANSKAETVIQEAIADSEKKRNEANTYYTERVAKADAEYQDILKRASEKHSQKIQESVNHLAELNDNIAIKNSELKELMQNQERQVACLMDIESLLTERQNALDTINSALLDSENALGKMTQRESERIEELQSQLQASQQSEVSLQGIIQELKLQNEQTLKAIQAEHEAEVLSLKFEIEKLSKLKEESAENYTNYEEQLQAIKDEYEAKIAQLNIDLDLANSLNFQIDLDNDDLQVSKLTKNIEKLEKKLALEAEKVDTLSSKLEKANKSLQLKESQIKELARKVVNMESERENLEISHKTELEELSTLHEELEESKALVIQLQQALSEKETEITALQEAKNLMSVNKNDYETVKDKFRELKSNYNISVNNQLGVKNKVVELIITAFIIVAASLYAFAFADGSQVYVGYLIMAIAGINMLYCCYSIHDKLSLAKDMKNTMEFN